jgi:hypothetical protein
MEFPFLDAAKFDANSSGQSSSAKWCGLLGPGTKKSFGGAAMSTHDGAKRVGSAVQGEF